MEILEKRLLEPYLRSVYSNFDSNKKTDPNLRISTSKLFIYILKRFLAFDREIFLKSVFKNQLK